MSMIWVWTGVIAFALIIEFMTMQLVTIWFAVGGIVGLILTIIGGISIEIQVACAVLVSIICIIGLRKFAMKYLNKKSEDKQVEMLVGHKAKMLEDVEKDVLGTIKLNGVVWTAYSDEKIEANEEVEIIEVNGNKLKVKKVN